MYLLMAIIGWVGEKSNPKPPDIEKSRPGKCPACKQVAWENGILWIIGHGCYLRWAYTPEEVQVAIRRFRCKNCKRTIQVSPHWLLPYYQYTASVILSCLTHYFVENTTVTEATEELLVNNDKQCWNLLYRWGKGFARSPSLWSWLRRSVGIETQPTYCREKLHGALERFFHSFKDRYEPGKTPDIEQIIQLSFVERWFDRHQTGVLYHTESGKRSPLIPQKARFSSPTYRECLTRAPP